MHPIRVGIFTAVNATTGGGLLPVAPNPQKPHMRMRMRALGGFEAHLVKQGPLKEGLSK